MLTPAQSIRLQLFSMFADNLSVKDFIYRSHPSYDKQAVTQKANALLADLEQLTQWILEPSHALQPHSIARTVQKSTSSPYVSVQIFHQ